MFIIVSNEIEDFERLEKSMDEISLSHLKNGYSRQVALWLPKFRIESDFDFKNLLNQVLKIFLS